MAEPSLATRSTRALFAGWLALFAVPASARWTTLGELAVHFGPYLAVLGFAVAGFLLALRARRLAAVGALLALQLVLPMARYFVPRTIPEHSEVELRVASANLHRARPSQLDLEGWLERHPAEVLAFQEVTLPTALHLRELLRERGQVELLPAEVSSWGPHTYGQVLFSSLPLARVERVYGRWRGPGYFSAELELEGEVLQLIAAHPMRPGRGGKTESRDAAYDSIAARAAQNPRTLVLGDLNSTEASPSFARLLERGRLRDSRLGLGWQPSFTPFEGALGALPLIPIDHVLAGDGLVVLERGRTENLGSDHWPVTAKVALAEPR